MTWIASSVLLPRSLNGTPEASNSRGSSTPTPTAGRRRPRESQSIVAISLAATTGVRYGRTITLGPNLSLLVRAATAARVVMTSGTGAGEERRSESQRESMPLCSRKSQSVQRNSPPSRPGGQGPGMMPMRYLISMGGDPTCRRGRRQAGAARVARVSCVSWCWLTPTAGAHRMNGDSALIMRDPDKPQQIIDAAVRVFARKGYFNSRVSDIAREAGIAAGTIYLYFKTKDDILVTLFRDKMAEFVGSLRKAIADEPDAVAKVRRLVVLHFRMLEDDPELAEVVQVELRQGQKFFRGASSQEIGAYFALIGSVLEEGVAQGRFRQDLPVKIATKMLFGAMDQMATSWVLGKRGYSLTDSAPAVAEIFLQGVAASPGA